MMHSATARELGKIQTFLLSRLLEHSGELPPELLYHYRDSHGLLGIINTRTLWATQFQYLNDSAEFIYANELMKEAIAEEPEGPLGSARARLRRSILEAQLADRDEFDDSDETHWLEQQFVTSFPNGVMG